MLEKWNQQVDPMRAKSAGDPGRCDRRPELADSQGRWSTPRSGWIYLL